MTLLRDLNDGQKREISGEDYDYFLNFLIPAEQPFMWNGERWHFGFAEGNAYVYAFKMQEGRYFAQKTNLLNPCECGFSLEQQLTTPGFAARVRQEVEAVRAASWIPTWLRLGKQNPWIRRAADPPFDTQSFCPCLNDDELLNKFERGNWCLGQAFYRGDLCFIQQVNGEDEWLAIKQDAVLDSVSFGRVIASKGRQAAQSVVDRLRKTTVERSASMTV